MQILRCGLPYSGINIADQIRFDIYLIYLLRPQESYKGDGRRRHMTLYCGIDTIATTA